MKNSFLISHLGIAIIVTLLSGVIYVTVQQSYRSGANDPQLQIARDIALALKNDRPIDHLLPPGTIEITESLAPFVVLYNINGEPIRSTGMFDGKQPNLPKGVFDFTKKNREDVLTWQPRKGVRMAMVVVAVQDNSIAFVAAGRSLTEVENRVGNCVKMILVGWLICIGVIVLNGIVTNLRKEKMNG